MADVLFYILLGLKYMAAIAIVAIIVMTPAWLARQTKKDKTNMTRVRLASWTLGWTGIAWLWALIFATRK